MSDRVENKRKISSLEAELYLLIAKFLRTGPCQGAAELLRKEIEDHGLLPKRVDWLGNEHSRSFNELVQQIPQITDDHLLKICERIGPVLDKEVPSTVPGLTSLLGVGRQSLLRTKEDLLKPKCRLSNLVARKNGLPLLPSQTVSSAYPPNIAQVLISRETSGPLSASHTLTPKLYARVQCHRRLLGHLSSVYCVLFDRTGKYIFSGADDNLVKIWSALDGRLLSTLRGHSAEITDMAVNHENTLLAAGSCDKSIRVWCLLTAAPVAILSGHTGMVTSLQFSPYPLKNEKLLISTGNDGCVCFWHYSPKNVFNPKPLKFTERNKANAQMICSSFSSGGMFLATGSTDCNVRVYNIAGTNGPEKILEREAHADRVDSIQFSNKDCRFISGSKDGSALVWKYERQHWTNIQLKMSTKLPGQSEEVCDSKDSKVKLLVTMVGWTLDDRKVITAVSDFSIRVWDSNRGDLIYVLKGHGDEVFVLESHPVDPRVFLSSGHDGRIIVWDLVTGTIIKNHFNLIEGQGHGAVFDCKFSPDGQMVVATDSHGHLSFFGFGSAERFKKLPEELFFHTDYRPLIRDIHHNVLDEQTQTAPHLLPPPFLVNMDGNPYPPHYQRLVPGRENLNEASLIPYIAVSAEGDPEILQPVIPVIEDQPNRPTIDDMIERLQQEQGRQGEDDQSVSSEATGESSGSNERLPRQNGRAGIGNSDQNDAESFSPRTPRSQAGHSRGVGLRRTGESEGVQSLGNWQSRGNESEAFGKRMIVKPMSPPQAKALTHRRKILAENEINFYNQERKKRSLFENLETQGRDSNLQFLRRAGMRPGLRSHPAEEESNTTPAEEQDPSNPENNSVSSSSSDTEQQDDTDSSDESEYSDWEEKTTRRKPRVESQPSTSAGRRPASLRQRIKPRRRLESSGDDESDEDSRNNDMDTSSQSQPGPSRQAKRKAAPSPKKTAVNGKKLERFRPPEWLTDVMPHKAPYVPQIGDVIVYFRQGHELYVQAVKRSRIYDICMRSQPWRQINLRDQEVARIDDITFENQPPRLCCLQLTLLNPARKNEDSFTVKYHDMPDVIDFIVLKKNYDTAIGHNWKPGDRFRSAIDKAWWLGTIKAQRPLNPDFPDSMFQCFFVKWDNGEKEHMSPWDFEPVDGNRLPGEEGGSVTITPEERAEMMYQPEVHEWSEYGRDEDCDRIARGFSRIMELGVSDSFVTPVDLNQYPSYAIVVEYPVDLGTIRARLQNRFYRRIDAVKFDVRYIALNAQKFNEPGSRIVKQAKCLVDLCLRFIEATYCTDPKIIYLEMLEVKQSRTQDSQSELDVLCSEIDSDDEHNNTPSRIKRKKQNAQMNKRIRLEAQKYTSLSWKEQCKALINNFFQCDDSTPFRHPVSLIEYPDYRDIVDHPMDLSTIRDRLENYMYTSPSDLCRDMRLMFQNSRNYNTNKKSRIYSMTIRLSAMFEEHIRSIISDWKSAVKYEEKIRNNQFVSDRRKPLLLQEDANVGASTSRSSFPSSSRSFSGQFSSRSEASRPSSSRTSYPEAGRSRGHSSKMTNGTASRKKSKLDSITMSPSKSSFNHMKKKISKSSLNSTLTNGIEKSVRRAAKRKKSDPSPKKLRLRTKTKVSDDEEQPSQSDSNLSDSKDLPVKSESDDLEWGQTAKKRRKDIYRKIRGSPKASIRRSQRKIRPSYHQRSSIYSSARSRPQSSEQKTPVRTRPPRRVREAQKPLRYREDAASFDSDDDSNESQSLKSEQNSISSGSSKASDVKPPASIRPKRTTVKYETTDNRESSTEHSASPESSEEEEDQAQIQRRTRRDRALAARLQNDDRMCTRNRGQRTVKYREGNSDDSENLDTYRAHGGSRATSRSQTFEEEQSPGMAGTKSGRKLPSTCDESSNSNQNLSMKSKPNILKENRLSEEVRQPYKLYQNSAVRRKLASTHSSTDNDNGNETTHRTEISNAERKHYKIKNCNVRLKKLSSTSIYGLRKTSRLGKRPAFKRPIYKKFYRNASGQSSRARQLRSTVGFVGKQTEISNGGHADSPSSAKTYTSDTEDRRNKPTIVFCKPSTSNNETSSKNKTENGETASRNSKSPDALLHTRSLKHTELPSRTDIEKSPQRLANPSVLQIQKSPKRIVSILQIQKSPKQVVSVQEVLIPPRAVGGKIKGKWCLRKPFPTSPSSSPTKLVESKIQTRFRGQRTVGCRDDIEDAANILENEDPVKQQQTHTSAENASKSTEIHQAKNKQSKASSSEAKANPKRSSVIRPKKEALKILSNGVETRNHGQRTTVYAEDGDDYLEEYFESLDSGY